MATTTKSNMQLNDDENINPLGNIYDDIMTLVENVVIKYNYLAEDNETVDTKSNADAYFDAYYARDNYFTYTDYNEDDCRYAGINSAYIKKLVLNSPKEVPRIYRDDLLASRRKRIIESFTEQNNYYRMLIGKPDLDDSDHINLMAYKNTVSSYGIDPSIDVDEIEEYYNAIQDGLGDYYIDLIEGLGILDELIELYPEKEYLNFLGNRRIDLYSARNAKNFEILRISQGTGIKSIVYDTFIQYYGQARDYIASTLYVVQFRTFIDYYDNFMAMCIMLMAINEVVVRQMPLGIRREFYDDNAIKMLYQAYDIPYNMNIDMEIQRGIMQNLNLLIQNKSTNKVFYDIISLLGYSSFNIYKYFLVKQRLYDAYGLPVTIWTKKYNTATGEYETVLDYTQMYEIYFQKVDLQETDIMNAFNDATNKVDYDSITVPDPLWYEDANLQNEIYNNVYNFIESKYIGIGINYSLTDIMFENVLLMKMLMKKKDEISTISLSLPKILEDSTVPLFDTIILLVCLMAKKHHLTGEIISCPTQVIAVLDYLTNLENGTAVETTDGNFGELVAAVKGFLVNPSDDTFMVDTFSFNFDKFVANMDTVPPVIKYVTAQGRYYIENSDGTFTYYSKEGNVINASVSSSALDELLSEGVLTIEIEEDEEPVVKYYTDWGTYFIYNENKEYYEYYSADDVLISTNPADTDVLLGVADEVKAEELNELRAHLLENEGIDADEIEVKKDYYYKLVGDQWLYYFAHDVYYMLLVGLLTRVIEENGAVNLMSAVKPVIGLLETKDAKELLSCLSMLSINSTYSNTRKIAAINTMYSNIRHLNTYLNYLMAKTHDRETYNALRTFYRTTFYSREMRELFYINGDEHNDYIEYDVETNSLISEVSSEDIDIDSYSRTTMSNGDVRYYSPDLTTYLIAKGRPAKTYFEFLRWYNPKLYNSVFYFNETEAYAQYLSENSLSSDDLSFDEYDALLCCGKINAKFDTLNNESELETVNENTVFNYINHILTRLEEIIDGLEMLYLINDSTSSLRDLLIKLIKFFKSYTVDLVSVDTVLICDMAALNMVKLLDEIYGIYKTIAVDDEIKLSYSDIVDRILVIRKRNDKLKFRDEAYTKTKIDKLDELFLRDDVRALTKSAIAIMDQLKLSFSDIGSMKTEVTKKDSVKFKDTITILEDE